MTTWYHGGPAGIHGRILPASETGAKTAHDMPLGMDVSHVRRDRVFLTDHYIAALMFACVWSDPMIYVVEPLGELEDDPDYHAPDGDVRSVQTTSAEIIRAIRPKAKLVKSARKAVLA